MDMFEALVDFGASAPVRTQVTSIRRTNVHRHPNAVKSSTCCPANCTSGSAAGSSTCAQAISWCSTAATRS